MNGTQENYIMSPERIASFISHEVQNGASENTIRRFTCAVNTVYNFLPEDKLLTRERLLEWRKSMEESGYASMTVQNYVKSLNRYLDFSGCSEIRFNRGKAKDISDMTFGYLTAVKPTGAKNRGDNVWLCRCKCGNTAELPATRLLLGNTLSCGCIKKEKFSRINKYIDNTSLRQSLDDQRESTRAVSGYTGVTPKRDKWQAYITYKGERYSLGCYSRIEDAVKARASAKQLVREDAMGLLNFYDEIHKLDPAIPHRSTEPVREFPKGDRKVNNAPASAAKRKDNRSGHTGVSLVRDRWEARICYKGVRYILGSFGSIDEAVCARLQAETELREDPENFEEVYKKNCKYHLYSRKNGQGDPA